jgi:hypothetical protein
MYVLRSGAAAVSAGGFAAFGVEDLECSVLGEEVEEVFDVVLVGGVENEEEAVLSSRNRFGEDRDAAAASVGRGDVFEELLLGVGRQRAGCGGVAVVGYE